MYMSHLLVVHLPLRFGDPVIVWRQEAKTPHHIQRKQTTTQIIKDKPPPLHTHLSPFLSWLIVHPFRALIIRQFKSHNPHKLLTLFQFGAVDARREVLDVDADVVAALPAPIFFGGRGGESAAKTQT